jgi:flagellar protein FlbT
MTLKVSLKPNEKIVIGNAVVTCGDSKADLIINNDVPILREKDVVTFETANTHCKRIYLAVQLMYLDPANAIQYQKEFHKLIGELMETCPTTILFVTQMQEHLIVGNYYKALRVCRELVQYEEELLNV